MTCMTTSITMLIAAIVAFIGLQQYLLARERFKLDLFERRLAIFKATQTFINEVIGFNSSSAKNASKWIHQFAMDAQTADFLFDAKTADFINEVWKKGNYVAVAYNLHSGPQTRPGTEEAFQKATKIQEEMITVQNQLHDKFAPYLKFSNWKYGFIWKILN